MQARNKESVSRREKSIIKLASRISNLMREHKDRCEAIDAYDMARVLFRKGERIGTY
jgi:hypothetical protein